MIHTIYASEGRMTTVERIALSDNRATMLSASLKDWCDAMSDGYEILEKDAEMFMESRVQVDAEHSVMLKRSEMLESVHSIISPGTQS